MRISKKSEYALRALIAIAGRGTSFQIQELSKQENIPVKFLEQILLALRHGGLLASKRGVGGGYSLRVRPSEIPVSQVIAIMDGPLAPVPCAAARPVEKCTCPNPANCAVRLFMTGVREELGSMLEKCSVEDLLRLSRQQDALAFEI